MIAHISGGGCGSGEVGRKSIDSVWLRKEKSSLLLSKDHKGISNNSEKLGLPLPLMASAVGLHPQKVFLKLSIPQIH